MSNLIPEVRADVNGKLVTRHVKGAGAAVTPKTLPAPALDSKAFRQRKRPAFKPSERQQQSFRFGIPMDTSDDADWGNLKNRPTSPELLAVSMNESQKHDFIGNYHRFDATEIEYYSVLSVARPWDAVNLLHRGIRTADEARAFLSEHGLDHLAGDHGNYVEEFLRKRIQPNLAASYLDRIIDYDAEPKNALEWVEACALKSIMDKAAVLDDEMLSGSVTINDLKAIGLKNAAVNMKAVGEAISLSKTGEYPHLTMDSIKSLAEIEVDSKSYNRWSGDEENSSESLEARLMVCRYHGHDRADGWLTIPAYQWKRDSLRETGTDDGKDLADYTVYASSLGTGLSDADYYRVIDKLHKAEVAPNVVRTMMKTAEYRRDESLRLLNAAAESIAPSVSSGWL